MLVFHGAMEKIEHPDVIHSRKQLDFGQGFYLARDYEQAKKWANRFNKRKLQGIVNFYELNLTQIEKQFKIKTFDSYDKEWLDYIVANRTGSDVEHYDIVSGGIANDRVFNTVELYQEKLISENETLGRLKYQKPNWQICVRNQEILDQYLMFQKSEVC